MPKNSNFEIFESALHRKSVSMPLRRNGTMHPVQEHLNTLGIVCLIQRLTELRMRMKRTVSHLRLLQCSQLFKVILTYQLIPKGDFHPCIEWLWQRLYSLTCWKNWKGALILQQNSWDLFPSCWSITQGPMPSVLFWK